MTPDKVANVTGIAEWHYVINTGRRPPFSIRLAQRPRFTHVLFKGNLVLIYYDKPISCRQNCTNATDLIRHDKTVLILLLDHVFKKLRFDIKWTMVATTNCNSGEDKKGTNDIFNCNTRQNTTGKTIPYPT